MKTLATAPTQGLHGKLDVPGDKSISHRALMLGAIAQGKTTIDHFLAGEDCLSTLEALRALGVEITRTNTTVIIRSAGRSAFKKPQKPLDMGNSGTTTRLLMGLLAGTNFTTTLVGDSSLQKRPMRRVSEPLAKLGVRVETTEQGTLPAKIYGGEVRASTVKLNVASAQVKSALIFASLMADEPSQIIEKLPTRNHTEIMINQFGGQIKTAADQRTITVQPKPKLIGQHVIVPGDMSSAAFFMVAATIIDNSDITLTNVNLNPTRTGILEALRKMGADITVTPVENKGEKIGNIRIKAAKLHAITIDAKDIPALIDELPLVALAAACADGTTKISGAQELRVKETDRIATVAMELRKFGIDITEFPDGLEIVGSQEWKVVDTQLDSHKDHRLGMMLAVAALRVRTKLTLKNATAIAVSYPNFFEDLELLLKNTKDGD